MALIMFSHTKILASMCLLAIGSTATAGTFVKPEPVQPQPVPQANVFSGSVNQLTGGCYAIKSPKTKKFIVHKKTADLVNNGMTYKFGNENQAVKFYFKPTGLNNTFMLRDNNDRVFATHLPAQISAGKIGGEFAEWLIRKNSADTFSFKATKLKRQLKHNSFSSTLNLSIWPYHEDSFQLVEKQGCTAFPEITTNVNSPNGDFSELKGNVNQPVRGFIDPHTHISSFMFMGGRMMAGKPFSPWGVEDALKDSKDLHGYKGSLDIIGNLYTYSDEGEPGLGHRYDTRGWPDFPFWPNYKQMSHMGYYYKWIERAHQAGLRIMVTNIVENEVLCNLQKAINPSGWVSTESCVTMNSIRNQITALYEMQDYIDAQAGGKGKGFFRIVTSPAQARRVIANGQLAVVLGIEASEIFNCGLKDKTCTREYVNKHLNEIYDLGIRSMFPIHKFNNQFGASPVEDGLMNAGNWLATGKFFKTEQCDAQTHGMKMTNGFPIIGKLPFFKEVLDAFKSNPYYDESFGHCSAQGITELGNYLVNRMIDKKMLIEFDHMSNKTANAVLKIAQRRGNYSGLITSHSWMRAANDGSEKGARDHYNVDRLLQMGGFAGAYNYETNRFGRNYKQYLRSVNKTGYLAGIGISTDMSGLGDQAPPRVDAQQNPLQYPFTTELGTVVHKQQSGNKVFDINQHGMAHFGMLADHIQDIRTNLDGEVYEGIMNSAEAYLQMWERAYNAPFTRHKDHKDFETR